MKKINFGVQFVDVKTETGATILINLDNVAYIGKSDGKTVFYLTNGESIPTLESLEFLLNVFSWQ